MKRRLLLFINLFICTILIIGFVGTALLSHNTYKKVIEDDIENISKLTSSNIYAEINSELTKPLFVSQTMANDSFLKTWLYDEKAGNADDKAKETLREYLAAYRDKYQYDAVYAISASSNVYYYYDGVNKIISPENEHDDWYYDFLESGLSYRLNIDTDEVNQNELTVFVDCRIVDKEGELLGVTGVGVKMSRLQDMLRQYESDYELETLLIDAKGNVKVSTDVEQIGSFNFFALPAIQNFKEAIINNKSDIEMHWYPENQNDHCIITHYIDNLDWYLIVHKNTQLLRSSFKELLIKDLIIIIVVLCLLLSIISVIIHWYNRRLSLFLNTDRLTRLPNQQAFKESFDQLKHGSYTLFLFDLDHFKDINDTDGHMKGNYILAQVAEISRRVLNERGMIARWGGDEFIGIIHCPITEAEQIMTELKQCIVKECSFSKGIVTISTGLCEIQKGSSLDDLTEQADKALYQAKAKGGNCISK